MRKRWAIIPAIAIAFGLTGCGATAATSGSTPAPKALASATVTTIQLPAKAVGHGSDGSTSTLTLSQHGDSFTGVYLVTLPGMPADTALKYDIVGTASNGKLDSTWTLGSVALHVTGHYTSQRITLDNPDGSFKTTVFTATR
jgi:hypothetical protein